MRLRAADDELRQVTIHLEALLRTEQPDLFDACGRLRADKLAKRIAERTANKRWLSGTELMELENANPT